MTDLKKLLEKTKNLPPQDGKPIFSFENIGDNIGARFEGRREGIKTDKSDNAKALDVAILESDLVNRSAVTGPHTIWESKHLTQIFSRKPLKVGGIFILRLASIDPKSGFKKFFFQIVEGESVTEPPATPTEHPNDDIPF